MKNITRILFISQEIYPFLSAETPVRKLNRQMPEFCQANGCETRTFMPKFGEINERRNQLHEVIRLSGMNIIIDDSDHPLLLKVASIQSARIQVYFIDNDDYFRRRKGVADEKGKEYEDNDERCIFFARGTIETVKKLCWTPDIVVCSGWMSALAPIYLKTAYQNEPFFKDVKVVYALDNSSFNQPFSTKFADKLLINGMYSKDLSTIQNKNVTSADLLKLGIQYSDAVIMAEENIDEDVLRFVKLTEKPSLPYQGQEPKPYMDYLKSLLNG